MRLLPILATWCKHYGWQSVLVSLRQAVWSEIIRDVLMLEYELSLSKIAGITLWRNHDILLSILHKPHNNAASFAYLWCLNLTFTSERVKRHIFWGGHAQQNRTRASRMSNQLVVEQYELYHIISYDVYRWWTSLILHWISPHVNHYLFILFLPPDTPLYLYNSLLHKRSWCICLDFSWAS